MSEPNGSGGDFSAFDDYAPGHPGPGEQGDADRPARPGAEPDPEPGRGAEAVQPAQDERASDRADHRTDKTADLTAGAEDALSAGRPEQPTTGNARVDAATGSLDQLDQLPTSQHADVFDEVHRRLQGALADLDVG